MHFPVNLLIEENLIWIDDDVGTVYATELYLPYFVLALPQIFFPTMNLD